MSAKIICLDTYRQEKVQRDIESGDPVVLEKYFKRKDYNIVDKMLNYQMAKYNFKGTKDNKGEIVDEK